MSMRVEGYAPVPGTPGTIPIYSWWNSVINDNYALTAGPNAPASNYQAPVFNSGALFATQVAGTTPCSTWWSVARNDWLTVCTAAGTAYAQQNGYALGNATIGYAYTNAPFTGAGFTNGVTAPTMAQWMRALDLLIL